MTAKVASITKKSEPLLARSDDDLRAAGRPRAPCGIRDARSEACSSAARILREEQRRSERRGGSRARDLARGMGSPHDYQPAGKFVVWLFTLARNRLRNAQRDLARRPSVAVDDPEPVLARSPDLAPSELDRLVVEERRARVDRALASVPANLREAIVLRFAEEMPYEDVARILDTNESTARSRVFHGIRDLRRRLRGES